MPGWVGAILQQQDASKQVPTILCTGSASHLSVKQGWKVSGLLCSKLKRGRTKLLFSSLRGSLRRRGLRFRWHRLLPDVTYIRSRKLALGIRENRERRHMWIYNVCIVLSLKMSLNWPLVTVTLRGKDFCAERAETLRDAVMRAVMTNTNCLTSKNMFFQNCFDKEERLAK